MADRQDTPDDAIGDEPVDAATYAAHLDRLDRLGREALAADPAEAIELVREANALVATLLPMHRRLMAELEHHRATLQAACEELAEDVPADERAGSGSDVARDRLDRLTGLGGTEGDAPF